MPSANNQTAVQTHSVDPPTVATSSSGCDVDRIIEQLQRCILPTEDEAESLCAKAIELFLQESNILTITAPVTVCGDVHGQFYDVLELFKIGGQVPDTRYLFLGDFVDRGFYSTETFLLCIAYKVRFPNSFHMLRGNHETRQTSQTYGFYDEVLRKYGSVNVWRACAEVFDVLPIAALVESFETGDKVFCVHGGLSPSINLLEDISILNRIRELPTEGPMCDLLWSDPDPDIQSWCTSERGAGYRFGKDIVEKFCAQNKISKIARAHQLVQEGFKEMFDKKLVTVWSAPNYCYRCGNMASVMELDENLTPEYKLFEAVPDELRGMPMRLTQPEYFM